MNYLSKDEYLYNLLDLKIIINKQEKFYKKYNSMWMFYDE